MSNSSQQTIGCGGLIALAVFSVLFISKCSGEPEDTLSSLDYDLRLLTDEVREKRFSLIRLEAECENDFPFSTPAEQGRRAQAEWDAAAEENLDNISAEQEWAIRQSLAAELGIAPSEVNGWKDIYRRRAEASRRRAERDREQRAFAQREWQEGKSRRCDVYKSTVQEVKNLEAEINGLCAKYNRMQDEAGLGYLPDRTCH